MTHLQTILMTSGEKTTPVVIFPTLPELVWSAIVLGVIFLIMLKFVVPKFVATIDERNATIAEGVNKAEQADALKAEAAREAEAQVAHAREEASEIRAAAQEQAAKTIAAAKAEANAEAQRIIEAGHRQVEANRQAAEISLRTDVGMLASQLAEQIVGEQLRDPAVSARVIDRFLDSLELEVPEKG